MPKLLRTREIALMLLFAVTFFCCGEMADEVKRARDHNDKKFDTEKEKTADFLVYAAELALHEIQLAELAAGNAKNPEVLKLARQTHRDHQKALEDIRGVASDKSIRLPGSASRQHQRECEKLGKKTGSEFEDDYCDLLVKQHEKAITRFEKAAENDEDEFVKKWAFDMLPVLRTHLDFAMSCREKITGDSDTAVVLNNMKDDDATTNAAAKVEADKKTTKKSDW